MRSSERPSDRTISPRERRARPYERRAGDHHVTSESRQLPEKVRGVQASIMAKMRKVEDLGFDADKNFHNDIFQIAYNTWIDESLRWYNFIMANLPDKESE